jgi:hypothetical protein
MHALNRIFAHQGGCEWLADQETSEATTVRFPLNGADNLRLIRFRVPRVNH